MAFHHVTISYCHFTVVRLTQALVVLVLIHIINLEVPVILQLRSATMRGGHCTPRAREEKLGSSGDVTRRFLDWRYFRNVDFMEATVMAE